MMMRKQMQKWFYGLGLAATLVLSSQASAGFNENLPVYDSEGDMIVGDGIPANGFAVDTATGGESVALKARHRDTGNALSIVDNVYTVHNGSSVNDPASPNWVFDFQFTPVEGSESADYVLELQVDYDSAANSTSFVTINAPVGGASSWAMVSPDGFFTNPGSGAWNDDTVPFVYSQSWHMDYSFWALLDANYTFDRDALGEYEIVLTLFDTDQNQLAQSSVIVNVIPEPASLALLGLGGLLMIRRKRN